MIWIIIILAGLGILNTIYLSYHSLTQKPVRCFFFPDEWCRRVQFSRFSKTLGVPNSFLGFFLYTVILILSILYADNAIGFWPTKILITFGFLFSLYFTLIQAFVLRAFCTWCVLSAVFFLFLTAIAWFLI